MKKKRLKMRYYMPLKSLAVFLFLSFCVQAVTAQNEEKLDTIYNPKVVYSAIPQKYEDCRYHGYRGSQL